MIKNPYLLYLGDAPDQLAAKVAQGISDWRPEDCVGQFRLPGCQADVGLPDLSIEQAVDAGAGTLVVGVANRGGVIADNWISVFDQALKAGLDIASGLHDLLQDIPTLVSTASQQGRQLTDVRIPTEAYPIAKGRRRVGKRCLAVGTDCAVGKMYTALAIEKAMHKKGISATFRATGQTGILITGEGVPLDAVVADFMAGSIEWLTPDNEPDHWDIVEGQGSLFHASFSGVSLALIHGSAPDALVLCHEPTRTHMRGLPDHSLPSLEQLRDAALSMALVVNPACRVIGVSVNTRALTEAEAETCLGEIESRLQLPAIDPFRHGASRLVEAL